MVYCVGNGSIAGVQNMLYTLAWNEMKHWCKICQKLYEAVKNYRSQMLNCDLVVTSNESMQRRSLGRDQAMT